MLNKNYFIQDKEGDNPFTVPDNYFESLPQQITDKCKQSNKIHKTVYLKRIVSYAAILIIGFTSIFLITYYVEMQNKKIQNYTYENIMEEMLYLAEMNDIDDTNIIDYMIEKNIYDNSFNSNTEDIINYIDTETNSDNEILELIDY